MIGEPRAYARNTDPETSWEAAFSVTGIRESQYVIWLALIENGPMTDEQIYQHALDLSWFLYDKPITESGARTRRAELVAKGLVKFNKSFGKTKTGRRTRVWRAVSLQQYQADKKPEQLSLMDE